MFPAGFTAFESLHKTKEGKIVPVSVHVRIIETEDGELVNLVQYHDISQKQEAERLLEKMHQQLKSLFQFNPDFIFMLNVQGFFTNVNPAAVPVDL
nr:PAS domain S-box protein [Domibacillus antri]